MSLEQFLAKLKKIDLNKIEKEILKELEPDIIDLNISQLAKGEGKSGSKLPEYENENYYKAKAAEGLTEQAGRHFNLLLTGNFREGMFLQQVAKGSFVYSKDSKTEKLNQMTNNDIFGLQKANLENLERDRIERMMVIKLEKAMT